MKGLGVSKGLCYAKVFIYEEKQIVLTDAVKNLEEELHMFQSAIEKVYKETEDLREKAYREAGRDAAEIFDAHCSIIMDEGLHKPIKEAIASGKNAAHAIEETMTQFVDMFAAMDDEYMALRALDIKDIKERLLRKVLCIETPDMTNLPEPCIIVGYDITPSTTAGLDMKNVAGILMELGGNTSHTAILARTLEIPAIVGVKDLMQKIKHGEMIGFDGKNGEIYLHMTKEQIQRFEKRRQEECKYKEKLLLIAHKESKTKDGKKIKLCANIGTPQDMEAVQKAGADGIGLFRSEFLYLQSTNLPSEKEQYYAYKKVLEGMDGKSVIVRTLDIGGDKDVPALAVKKEENPFLGLRAIRLCASKQKIFRTQLRALLRASVHGKLKIMFPMISSIEELDWAKSMLFACKEELKEENVQVSDNIPIGIMVEIPSTAVMAEVFAKECDFFSIGTNDLIQYTLAVDRGNEAVASLYNQFHPAVLYMIRSAIAGAHKAGIMCGMCGEAAGDLYMIPLLVGMGLDEFSMSASTLLEAKEVIRQLETEECKKLAEKVLCTKTAFETERILKNFAKKRREKIC